MYIAFSVGLASQRQRMNNRGSGTMLRFLSRGELGMCPTAFGLPAFSRSLPENQHVALTVNDRCCMHRHLQLVDRFGQAPIVRRCCCCRCCHCCCCYCSFSFRVLSSKGVSRLIGAGGYPHRKRLHILLLAFMQHTNLPHRDFGSAVPKLVGVRPIRLSRRRRGRP